MVVTELEIEVTRVGYLYGVVARFLELREERAHIFFAFQVELICFKTHAVFFIEVLTGLDTEKNILII